MRMERASAQTMAEEMAARWWGNGKKDLGEARLSPYTVESCPLVPWAGVEVGANVIHGRGFG